VVAIPTTYGVLVEHDDADVERAEQDMRAHLARLEHPTGKTPHVLDRIWKLWVGWDGTKSMRGVRVLPTADAVGRVASLAGDARSPVRIAVFVALDWSGDAAALSCTDAFERGLRDTDPLVRIRAASALASLCSRTRFRTGPIPPSLVPVLNQALGDPVWSVRWHAVAALARTVPTTPLIDVLFASRPTKAHLPDWLDAAKAIPDPSPELTSIIHDAEMELGRR
jgi:hypothetical protein